MWTRSRSCTALRALCTVPTQCRESCKYSPIAERPPLLNWPSMAMAEHSEPATAGAQLSGLLGAFDYSVGGGYVASNGQGPDDFFRDATQSGNFGWKFTDHDSLRLSIRNSASDAGQPGQTLFGPEFSNLDESSALHDFSSNLNWQFDATDRWHFQPFGLRIPVPPLRSLRARPIRQFRWTISTARDSTANPHIRFAMEPSPRVT